MKRWDNSNRDWTGFQFANSQGAMEDKQKWEFVAKTSMASPMTQRLKGLVKAERISSEMITLEGARVLYSTTVTQYPIPAITVPGRMRYSRHKRSGISYGCHNVNESPRTTFSCHKRSCFAISYPLSRIYCRCRMYRRFGVGVSVDDCSLLPPPNGSSMAMQINARTHSEPFMATKCFHIPPPQTFYANAIFPHTLDLLWQ